MQSSSSIDLIKGKQSLSDEIIKWALSFGRLLIILVEIVAFSAFIYRFSLDRKLVDYNDKIRNEQAIIVATKDREAVYRSLHERIATVKRVTTTGNIYEKMLNDIVASTPPEVTYNTFFVENGKLNLEINVTSITSMTEFVKFLQSYPQIDSVSVTGINNISGENAVKVSLVARLKEISQ